MSNCKEIKAGDTFRILGTCDLWVATYLEGSFNLMQLNCHGWLDIDSPKLFDGFDTPEGLENAMDGSFVYVGNVYHNDDFLAEYI